MKILISGPFEPKQIFCEEIGVDFPSGFGGVPVNLLVSELSKMGHEVMVVGTSSHINETWTYRKIISAPFWYPLENEQDI